MTNKPLIITCAIVGAELTKQDTPYLPTTPDEIAQAAKEAVDAGASIIHLHVRDAVGFHTLGVAAYRRATAAIRKTVGENLIIQVSSEAVGLYHRDEQMAMIRALRPEAVSLALREFIPAAADESSAAAFFGWLGRERILPQYILYSAEEVRYFRELRRRGLVPGERPFVLFVLGRYNCGQPAAPRDLLAFLTAHDPECPWAVCSFGSQEAACTITAIGLQGHTRVGFENNLLLSDGALAPDNAALVAQNVAAASLVGREVADADRARKLLGSY